MSYGLDCADNLKNERLGISEPFYQILTKNAVISVLSCFGYKKPSRQTFHFRWISSDF